MLEFMEVGASVQLTSIGVIVGNDPIALQHVMGIRCSNTDAFPSEWRSRVRFHAVASVNSLYVLMPQHFSYINKVNLMFKLNYRLMLGLCLSPFLMRSARATVLQRDLAIGGRSVCLSVCLSHVGIDLKLMIIGSRGFLHRVRSTPLTVIF